MEWPLRDEKTGKPKTTPTNQLVWRTALEAALQEDDDAMMISSPVRTEIEAWMETMDQTQNWRKEYPNIVGEFGRICAALLTPPQVLRVAKAGLTALHEHMQFRTSGSSDLTTTTTATISAKQAFLIDVQEERSGWTTKTIRGGTQNKNAAVLTLPSPQDPSCVLTGDDAVAQVQAWVDYGCMEPSALEHASKIYSATPAVLQEILSNKVFVLLGVTSALGPAKPLLQLPGTHVLGIARNGNKLTRLVEWCQEQGHAEATLQVPNDGADLLQDGPRIARWIVENLPEDRNQVVISHLAYMDGEANVRALVAMDLISDAVAKYCDQRNKKVALSFLISPSTPLLVPEEAALDAQSRYEKSPFWHGLARNIAGMLQPWDFASRPRPLYNGIASVQGPNYALAKVMQQWRCMVAFQDGRVVSAPPAPPSRSDNMVSHASIAAFLEGMQLLEPNVVFDVGPCASLMFSIMLSQVSTATDTNKDMDHPMQLFWDGAVHGGCWRCPYTAESAGTLSYILGKTVAPSHYVPPKSLAAATKQ